MTTPCTANTPDDQPKNQATLERSRATVLGFLTLAFHKQKEEEAVARYVGSTSIQYNPRIPDGIAGLLDLCLGPSGAVPAGTE